jgi:nicotinate-nucleotide adenylyltransferase
MLRDLGTPATMAGLKQKIQKVFLKNFGETTLRQRNEDILQEAIEISRFSSIKNLKEEHGDLICSLLMSFHENSWDVEDCINATLKKIESRARQYQAYGRKLNVAILGGAFDPIHLGHIAIAEFLLNFSGIFDEVWITPCFSHLYNKKMASPKHRLEMCRLATGHDRRIKVFNYEIKNKLGGETYHFVKRLMNEDYAKNKYNFSMAIGADNANTFDKWVNYQDLEKMIRFIVVPRSGVELNPKSNWYMKPPHMLLIPEIVIPNISSTGIRKELEFLWHHSFNVKPQLLEGLDGKVIDHIKKNRLYRQETKK